MDQLIGITFEDLWKLLRENRFAISPRFLGRILFILALSRRNSKNKKIEEELYKEKISGVNVIAPVFILGHWRSGTTLLHNLLSQDKQFGFPTIYQVSNPHGFLTNEDSFYQQWGARKSQKRVTDNMQFVPNGPGEDEFAISAMCQLSPLIGWSFPKRMVYYDRYLTFQAVQRDEIKLWKDTLATFLKKVTYKTLNGTTVSHGTTVSQHLLLKSPTHTARIKMILELFPDARFIHITRDPYQVFQSSLRLFQKAIPNGCLQPVPTHAELIQGILIRYQEMYNAFFEQSQLIPHGRFVEIRFEQLEKDMIGNIRLIYEKLGIPGYPENEPDLRAYVETIRNYQKNQHTPISETVQLQVAEAWQRNFESWGYPT